MSWDLRLSIHAELWGSGNYCWSVIYCLWWADVTWPATAGISELLCNRKGSLLGEFKGQRELWEEFKSNQKTKVCAKCRSNMFKRHSKAGRKVKRVRWPIIEMWTLSHWGHSFVGLHRDEKSKTCLYFLLDTPGPSLHSYQSFRVISTSPVKALRKSQTLQNMYSCSLNYGSAIDKLSKLSTLRCFL